jgi:hypothetical protein
MLAGAVALGTERSDPLLCRFIRAVPAVKSRLENWLRFSLVGLQNQAEESGGKQSYVSVAPRR